MSTIQWEDFEKVDMLEVREFPNARRPAYQLTIDFGALGLKRSSAQVTDLYDLQQLLGRQVIAVVNFPPKQIANFFSECLVLGVYTDKKEVVLLEPERTVANGWKIG